MLDLIYDLSPDEDIAHVEGHLLVLLLGDDALSQAVADRVERKVERLDDSSEFRLAAVDAESYEALSKRASELPALFHFSDGVIRSTNNGADDCLEFFAEFVVANRCRKHVKRR